MNEQKLKVVQLKSGKTSEVRRSRARKKLLSGKDPAVRRSNLMEIADGIETKFGLAGGLEPALDPLILVRIHSLSNVLRQLVDTMVQNVHGGGYRFERTIDLESDEGWERVKSAIWIEREREVEESSTTGDKPDAIEEPTDDEVDARIDELRNRQWRELIKLKSFFKNFGGKISFTRLRRKMGIDYEVTGYGVWEVRRNLRGEPRRASHAPSWTMRAKELDDPIELPVKVSYTDISYDEETEYRAFRRFVQIYEGRTVYFKEFGDPRVVSSDTGEVYADEKEMKLHETNAKPATEILWFQQDNPESDVYGMPRWTGNVLSAIGSREMEEANLAFWEENGIPAMVVLVHGGNIAADAKEEFEELIQHEVKGNQHKLVVLEAMPAAGAGALSGAAGQQVAKIELVPLNDHIMKDQMWTNYDVSNRKKLRESFRFPSILIGDTKELNNRATAGWALRQANDQVFEPERADFDFTINETILPSLDVMLWKFVSVAPHSDDPDTLLEAVIKLVETIMSPSEARELVARLLNIELPKLEADWSQLPLKYGLAGFRPDNDDDDLDDEEGEPEEADDEDEIDENDDDDKEQDENENESDDDEENQSKHFVTKLRIPKDKFDRIFGNKD